MLGGWGGEGGSGVRGCAVVVGSGGDWGDGGVVVLSVGVGGVVGWGEEEVAVERENMIIRCSFLLCLIVLFKYIMFFWVIWKVLIFLHFMFGVGFIELICVC